MSDIIKILPTEVLNKIAAGEVVQRPASVVKELMENSIDAKSTKIKLIVRDSGKTLIQVVDNGEGMSKNDMKMSFMKHATSKITKIEDIFSITSMGFRGELVEPKYTEGISSTDLISAVKAQGITPGKRMKTLRRLIGIKPIVRILEAHNGLTGLIAEKTSINKDGKNIEFDGIWESSLTDSTAKGKPDTELVDFSSRFSTIEEILEVTTKPIIVDGDTGGRIGHFKFRVKTLERLGVSAIIIEDKIGDKRNSLFGTTVPQEQDTIEHFSQKIHEGKRSQVTEDFMIIARVESLILKKGMKDALKRAAAYISAGADGIMIHSKEKNGKEIIEFCEKFEKFETKVPLIVVPSTYAHMNESELEKLGVNVIIYANHLLRSAYPAMMNAAKSIPKWKIGRASCRERV